MTISADRKVKVGVFGVGSLGQHHARVYSELDGVELVGVCDVDFVRATEIAGKYGTRAFADVDQLATQVEAASVVVPTNKHFEAFCALKQHGVHMMVEKPIAALADQAQQMIKMAREAKLILQVGHIERFNPVMRFLEDEFKTPTYIEAVRLAPYPPQRPGLPPRGTEVSVVLDLMIHDLDILLHIVKSPVREIRATGVSVLSDSEDIANARIVFENGCVANVTSSRISLEPMRRVQIYQGDAYVILDYSNQAGKLVRKRDTGIESEDIPVQKADALTNELRSFIDCVVHRTDPVVDGAQGFAALQLAIDICRMIASNPS